MKDILSSKEFNFFMACPIFCVCWHYWQISNFNGYLGSLLSFQRRRLERINSNPIDSLEWSTSLWIRLIRCYVEGTFGVEKQIKICETSNFFLLFLWFWILLHFGCFGINICFISNLFDFSIGMFFANWWSDFHKR